jgi:hypothetical protein
MVSNGVAAVALAALTVAATATAAAAEVYAEPLLVCYMANLHSHTQRSDGLFASDGAWDAYDYTQPRGLLQVLAITDHAEDLNDGEWGANYNAFCNANRKRFVALNGFEWTGTNFWGDGPGHMNVFGSMTRVGAYDGDSEVVDGHLAMYSWLYANRNTTFDGKPLVAQFNHPTTYDISHHFGDFQYFANGAAVIGLMELGSYFLNSYEGRDDNGSGDPDRDNELWWRLALDKGWRLAPTNNGDTHSVAYDESDGYTGIYAPEVGKRHTNYARYSAIMDGLRARRTFATEDLDSRVLMKLRVGGLAQAHWMGTALSLSSGFGSVALELLTTNALQGGSDTIDHVRVYTVNGGLFRAWDGLGNSNPGFFKTSVWIDEQQLRSMPKTAQGDVYFYVRVRQNDGDHLYSAPVWIKLLN